MSRSAHGARFQDTGVLLKLIRRCIMCCGDIWAEIRVSRTVSDDSFDLAYSCEAKSFLQNWPGNTSVRDFWLLYRRPQRPEMRCARGPSSLNHLGVGESGRSPCARPPAVRGGLPRSNHLHFIASMVTSAPPAIAGLTMYPDHRGGPDRGRRRRHCHSCSRSSYASCESDPALGAKTANRDVAN